MFEKNKRNQIIVLGVLSCLLGIILISNNYIDKKILKAYDKMNLDLLAFNEQKEKPVKKEEKPIVNEKPLNKPVVNKKPIEKPKPAVVKKYYIAKLLIPKINLEQGLVAIDSPYNNVNRNIQIIKPSNYPDVVKGNLILASHSGTGSISYFHNLYKIEKNDKCYIKYKGKTYTYEVVSIYQKPKTGRLAIYRDYNETTLTLITCTKGVNDKQTIYIANLINIL